MQTQSDTASPLVPDYLRDYIVRSLQDVVVSTVTYDDLRKKLTLEVAVRCADGVAKVFSLTFTDEQLLFFNSNFPNRAEVLQAVVDTALPELARIRMRDPG